MEGTTNLVLEAIQYVRVEFKNPKGELANFTGKVRISHKHGPRLTPTALSLIVQSMIQSSTISALNPLSVSINTVTHSFHNFHEKVHFQTWSWSETKIWKPFLSGALASCSYFLYSLFVAFVERVLH